MKVLGHSFVCLLIRSYRSLICLIHTACFARALHCAHLFACLLISFISKLLGKWMIRWLFFLSFFLFWTKVHSLLRAGMGSERDQSGPIIIINTDTGHHHSQTVLTLSSSPWSSHLLPLFKTPKESIFLESLCHVCGGLIQSTITSQYKIENIVSSLTACAWISMLNALTISSTDFS